MKITLTAKAPGQVHTACMLQFYTEESRPQTGTRGGRSSDPLEATLACQDQFEAKPGQVQLIPGETQTLIAVGLGSEKKVTPAALRSAAGTGMQQARRLKTPSVAVLPYRSGKSKEDAAYVGALLEGIQLGAYDFTHKTEAPKKKVLSEVILCRARSSWQRLLDESEIMAQAVCFARDLVNRNAGEKYPERLVAEARLVARKHHLKEEILNEKDIEAKGLRLLQAVGQGAAHPPRLVILSYRKAKNRKTLAIVGKGITFDTGGLNLKPTGHIEDMRLDMAGAAAALGAMQAVASLNLKVNLIVAMVLAENAIGPDAYKPGDVFRAYNGKTVQINNTDAEGRLVVADALSYVDQQYKPDFILDLATLTGACLVALGTQYAALLTQDNGFQKRILAAAEVTDEKVWPLPLTEPFMKIMDGDISDLRNSGKSRWAGTIQGGVFLSHFVTHARFAHLDIAGTAWGEEPSGHLPKYATGYGVRLVTELVRHL